MDIIIQDKADFEAIDEIIALGYPNNIDYMEELLSWTCDPNWPIADVIYQYFNELGKREVARVIKVAKKADYDWRYSIITQILAYYDDDSLNECIDYLKLWAKQTGSQECDIESIRILAERELISAHEVSKIAKRNLFVYNIWIKETIEAAGKSINSLPLKDHKL